MAKPKTIHTIESLLKNTEELGECRIWKGYFVNGTPYVYHLTGMKAVRRVMTELKGKPIKPGAYFVSTCRDPACVNPAHIMQQDEKAHCKKMAKSSNTGSNATKKKAAMLLWRRANPIKLDEERASLIRADERPYRQIAEEFGVSHSLVGKIKRGTYWRDTNNPFSQLFASNDQHRRAA